MKRVIALCVVICVMASLSLRAENFDYGIGSAIENQENKLLYSEKDIEQLKDLIEKMQANKTIYTEKDVEQLASLGTTAIRALLVPTINLFGALQPVLQTLLTMPAMQNLIPVLINPFESMIYQLAAPAIRLATGREVINIDGATLYDMIQSGQELQLIDVRTPGEWEQIRVPGAINIPMQNVNAALQDGTIKPGIPIVYICQSGFRAFMTGLLTLTYDEFSNTPVYNLEGGTIGAWVEEGYPTEGELGTGDTVNPPGENEAYIPPGLIRGGC